MRSESRDMLLERHREISALEQCVEDAVSGHGSFAVVRGPAGIGKTQLLDAASEIGRARGATVLTAAGDELERDYPLGLIRRLLERHLERLPDATIARVRRGRAEVAWSVLASLGDSALQVTDASELTHSLYWLVTRLTEIEPLALVIDDLQWCDQPSLQVLYHLVHRLEDLPLAVIAAVRTIEPSEQSSLLERTLLQAPVSLELQELSRDGVREAMRTILDDEPTDSAVDRVLTLTRGNPFLLRHITAGEGVTDLAGETTELVAPDAVSASIRLRLASLGEGAIGVARAISVLGSIGHLEDVAGISGLTLSETMSAIDVLRQSQILSAADVSFYHPLTRAAVYGSLSAEDRAARHLAAAKMLWESDGEVDRVASHLALAAPTSEDWARSVLRTAARDAARKGAPSVAAQHLRQLLRFAAWDETERATLLLDLGTMEAATGERAALAHLEEALSLIASPDERERAMFALGQTLFRHGRAEEAGSVFRRGAEEFAAHPETALSFEAGLAAASAYLVESAPEALPRLTELSAPFINSTNLSAAERLILLHLGVFRAMCEPDVSSHAELILRALGDGVQLWRETSDGMVIGHAVIALTWCGRPRDAALVGERMLMEARARGDSLIHAEVSLGQAMALYALGDVDGAASSARSALDGMSHGWMSTVPAPEGVLAYCFIDRGELEHADRILREAEGHLRVGGTRALNVWYYAARGRLRAARGQHRLAADDFRSAGTLLATNTFRNPAYMLGPLLAWEGRSRVAAGEANARELILRDLAASDEFGLPLNRAAGLAVLASVSDGSVKSDILEESRQLLVGTNASQLELANVLCSLGEAQASAGHIEVARETLRQSLDLAHTAGATATVERAHEMLLTIGARPRRAAMTGRHSFTPSEARIAELYAQGLTTRAIADALYLSVSTVEWHRRNVYRKLDVTTREQLAHVMAS